MTAPELTVVVPVFNKAYELGIFLQLLERQSLPPEQWELVIVDDGSTDDSVSIAGGATGITIKTLSLDGRSRSPARARNIGAAMARGRVLVFLDPDVLPCRDLLLCHVNALAGDSWRVSLGYMYAVGFGSVDFRNGYGDDWDFGNIDSCIERAGALPMLQDCRRRWADSDEGFGALPCPWSGCWSGNLGLLAAMFEAVGGFDEDFRDRGAEDIEFGYRLSLRGARFEFSREAQGFHFPHPKEDARYRELDTDHYRLFLQKHPSLAVELLAIFGCSEVNDAARRLSTLLPATVDPRLTWDGLLQLREQLSPAGGRSCFSGALPHNRQQLRSDLIVLKGACDWIGDSDIAVSLESESSMLGMATPFEFGSFELAVIVDTWATLPSAVASAHIMEASRIARVVVCVMTRRLERDAIALRGEVLDGVTLDERTLWPPIDGIAAVFLAVPKQIVPKDVRIFLDGLSLNIEGSLLQRSSIVQEAPLDQ
jgi:glycosyltransferase involved in cell wall biosynthesis